MMTSRSDVSKMLVSHHSGHAGSVVSSSSHQTQATSRLSSRLEHQKNKTSKKKSLNSISVQKPCVASHHHTYASQVNSSTEDVSYYWHPSNILFIYFHRGRHLLRKRS
jgi:Ca2+-dependent lipid-binding protein